MVHFLRSLALAAFVGFSAANSAPAQRTSIDCLVRTPAGQPIDGATLCVGTPEDFDQNSFASGSKLIVARSDARGRLRASLPAAIDGVHRYAWVGAPGRASRWLPWSQGDGQPRTYQRRVTLVAGVAIQGQVLGADGKPFEGAQIRARDVLLGASLRHFKAGLMQEHFASFARSDSRGRFRLEGVLPLGVTVAAHAAGHHVTREGFAHIHRPLVLRLRRGGEVLGRVLDGAGQPVDAWVKVLHVGGVAPLARVRTDREGRYRCSLRFAGRYRVRAESVSGHLNPEPVESPIFDVPKKDVDLRIPKPDLDSQVVLHVLDGPSGKPLTVGRAAIRWLQSGPLEASDATWLPHKLPGRRLGVGGVVILPGPRKAGAGNAVVFVSAPGYGTRCLAPLIPGAKPVKVPMEPEASIRGLVVDAKGRPVAGAKVAVLCLKKRSGAPAFGTSIWNGGVRPGFVRTDARGEFRLAGRSAGRYQLEVRHVGFRDGKLRRLVLVAGKEESVRVVLQAGVRWGGVLSGNGGRRDLALVLRRANSGVRGVAFAALFRHADEVVGANGGLGGGVGARIQVDEQGRFAAPPLHPGRYTLLLQTDGGGAVPVPHERPLRVIRLDEDDLEVRFDISEDVPGAVAGRIEFAGSVLPPGRLAAVAVAHTLGSVMLAGIDLLPALSYRTAVSPQRGFRLEVPPGRYHIGLIDLETGLMVHKTKKAVQVLGGLTETFVCRPDLTPVRFTWEAAKGADPVTRLQLRFPDANGLFRFMGMEVPDFGSGALIQPGQNELEAFLPKSEAEVLLRNEEYLLTGDERRSAVPVARSVVEPEEGKVTRVHLRRD